MNIHKTLPQAISVLITIIVLSYIIIVPIGVADGGGQYKIVESLGLNYILTPTSDFFATQYSISSDAQVNDTHSLIVALAIGSSKDVFNVRSLAMIYGILFIIGIWIAVKSGIRDDKFNWAVALLSVFIFADIGYTAYFNTLYSEGAILTTLILCLALIFLCHKKKEVPIYLIVVTAVSSIAFSFCGTIHALVAVIFGIIIFRLNTICNKKTNKYLSIICGVAVIILSLTFAIAYKPVDYEKNIFHSVFLGTAKHDSVESLGLSPALNELQGQFFSEEFVDKYDLNQEFFNKINYGKIIKFYLTHPVAYVKEYNGAVRNAYTVRPSYLGNFTQESQKGKELAGGFSFYSTLKGTFVPNTFTFTSTFFLIYLGILIYLYISEKEKRPILEVLIGIIVAASMCLKIPVILSGGYEIGRALFTFNIMFDSMIILAVVAGGRYMSQRRKHLQDKFGANQ